MSSTSSAHRARTSSDSKAHARNAGLATKDWSAHAIHLSRKHGRHGLASVPGIPKSKCASSPGPNDRGLLPKTKTAFVEQAAEIEAVLSGKGQTLIDCSDGIGDRKPGPNRSQEQRVKVLASAPNQPLLVSPQSLDPARGADRICQALLSVLHLPDVIPPIVTKSRRSAASPSPKQPKLIRIPRLRTHVSASKLHALESQGGSSREEDMGRKLHHFTGVIRGRLGCRSRA
jgi:hypothetical protein